MYSGVEDYVDRLPDFLTHYVKSRIVRARKSILDSAIEEVPWAS